MLKCNKISHLCAAIMLIASISAIKSEARSCQGKLVVACADHSEPGCDELYMSHKALGYCTQCYNKNNEGECRANHQYGKCEPKKFDPN